MPEDYRLHLYHTLGCHLCDDAEALLKPLSEYLSSPYIKIDIADDDALVERYGIRIPVVYVVSSGKELGWPFDMNQLFTLLTTSS